MVYQEEQQKQWHHATSIPGQGYNPYEINEVILESTQDSSLREWCWKDDKIYKALVSNHLLSLTLRTSNLTIAIKKK